LLTSKPTLGNKNLEIEGLAARCIFETAMSTIATAPKKKTYSKSSLEAGDRLLKAVKEKLLREKGKIDYAALRHNGYSEALIARLKEV